MWAWGLIGLVFRNSKIQNRDPGVFEFLFVQGLNLHIRLFRSKEGQKQFLKHFCWEIRHIFAAQKL